MAGAFSDEVHGLTQALIRLRMLVEATLDFPEEEIDFLQQADALGQLQQLMQASEKLHEQSRQGVLLREGLQLVIVGQPNVGKSALLNALSGKDTAIVTPIPGTTRDALAQTIHIDDVPIHVVDTAGLRDDQADEIDVVEKIGIERAWQHLEKADAVLFLHDLSRQDQAAYRQCDAELQTLIEQRLGPQQRCLQVWNKVDLLTDTPVPERDDSDPEVVPVELLSEGVCINAHLAAQADLVVMTEGSHAGFVSLLRDGAVLVLLHPYRAGTPRPRTSRSTPACARSSTCSSIRFRSTTSAIPATPRCAATCTPSILFR
jgi:small GTP-binding protein